MSAGVLITEGGSGESRAALAAVRALGPAGYRPIVTVSGEWSLAGASRHCARRVPVPFVRQDPQGYAAAVRAELAVRPCLAALPANDLAHLALGLPGHELLDKEVCGELAERAGFPRVEGWTFGGAEEVLDAAEGLAYPVVVKPAVKHALAALAGSPAELRTAAARLARVPGAILVQRYLPDPPHGILGLMHGGRLVLAMHMRYLRMWPLPCGTVSAAVTTRPDEETEERLAALMAGYDGVFHADLVGPWLLDLNPRIHATLPLARAAGIDPVVAHCRLLEGKRVPPERARAGVFYRWIEGDLRSLARGLREGTVGPGGALIALRPRRGTAHSLLSPGDLGPLWARARFLGRRLRTGRPYGAPAPGRVPA